MNIDKAIESFVRGVGYTRSFTHPCEGISIGERAWILRDAPGKKRDPRNSEVTVYGWEPEAVVELVRANVTGKYFLCALTDNDAESIPVAAAYKRLGYRLMRREPFFVAETNSGPRYDSPIRRIMNQIDADAVTKAAGSKQIRPEELADENPALRLYAAYEGETPVGWARSIRTHNDCGWVAGLYVQEPHRGKGLGRALMSALLADDAQRGLTHSVLLASHAGARLYPHVGYRQIGLLLVMAPPKESVSGQQTADSGR